MNHSSATITTQSKQSHVNRIVSHSVVLFVSSWFTPLRLGAFA
jgi:hypothetical protein